MISRHLNVASLTRLPPWVPTLIIGVVGLFVTLGVWHLTTTAETRAREIEFFGRANNQRTLLQNGIADYGNKLYAIRAFFESSDNITREDFETFSSALLEGFPAILNVGWLPRITREHRAAHELEGARDGLPDYHIRAILPDGSRPVAPDRDEYFPKFYSTEPTTWTARVASAR